MIIKNGNKIVGVYNADTHRIQIQSNDEDLEQIADQLVKFDGIRIMTYNNESTDKLIIDGTTIVNTKDENFTEVLEELLLEMGYSLQTNTSSVLTVKARIKK